MIIYLYNDEGEGLSGFSSYALYDILEPISLMAAAIVLC
jgi:hypothetical protein